MSHRGVLLAGLVLVMAASWAFPASAAEFGSCADIREYFRAPLPQNPYARAQDLEKVVEVLRREIASPSDHCEEWVIERGFFEYATALDEYSRTFPEDGRAMQRWARDAAE